MSYLELAKKVEARIKGLQNEASAPPSESVDVSMIDGDVQAILIDSPIVGLVWFAFADDFRSGDDIPVFFASELPFLRRMSEAELRRRYAEKVALGGGWIRDRIEEPTKH